MINVPELFGSMVFNEAVMKERLPEAVYREFLKTLEEGKELDISLANVIAGAMKDWALEKGATHFTHWFQPLTGATSEKHDALITPQKDGTVIMEFSGKELVRGESDASSFPSGGLRATCEARGYTVWDPTSYAFIKDGCLCIPTAFCSYGGEALDKKTPLLRSMEAISAQAVRVLKLFGHKDVKSVKTTVGPEQEYFLVDKDVFDKRKDLIYAGRTLFGAQPPKGQDMEGHYFGIIKPRVQAFMKELNEELWKLGVPAKTEHNETAPAQHETAPVFATANIATDHNQLTMELLQKIARKHGMVCLLHEKPFNGVNGSGKHNNWSVCTDTGINLLEPGDTPKENAQFLLFFCAVIKAVDEYQDLLRISVASAGNDLRLGANEAPPAIVSMFIGEDLEDILKAIASGTALDTKAVEQLKVGVHVLPKIPRDTSDRNRTSPFAFTGNKFEFRMLGSSESAACTNIMLNTAVAESLRVFADRLEKAADFKKELDAIIKDVINKNGRIIFNGNGYGEEWVKEAERRGLLNLKTMPDAYPHYLDEKNKKLFARHGVLSESEMHARFEIGMEHYCKTIKIEALTMINMTEKEILPAVSRFEKDLAETVINKRAADKTADCAYETFVLKELSALTGRALDSVQRLKSLVRDAENVAGITPQAQFYRDRILPEMENLRASCDRMEEKTAKDYWPFPSYGDLLYSVK